MKIGDPSCRKLKGILAFLARSLSTIRRPSVPTGMVQGAIRKNARASRHLLTVALELMDEARGSLDPLRSRSHQLQPKVAQDLSPPPTEASGTTATRAAVQCSRRPRPRRTQR